MEHRIVDFTIDKEDIIQSHFWSEIEYFNYLTRFLKQFKEEGPVEQYELYVRISVTQAPFNKYTLLQHKATKEGRDHLTALPEPWMFDRAIFLYEGYSTIRNFAMVFRTKTTLEQLVGY